MSARPIAGALLEWFQRHGRTALPWRVERTPYRIVVSEFMLQQTQVERVVPIFAQFVARWSTFEALAAASQADVLRAWKGLGYNSRAVRLHRLARIVAERFAGVLPRTEVELRSLPGIGSYTARAIAAFAFDADVVALDTNIRRVVHRTQFGIEWPPLASGVELDARAALLVPSGAGFAFNSALMDLGATLCGARAPKCLLCPLHTACAAAPIDPAALARRAAQYPQRATPQERLPFEKTTRYVRGRIVDRLRELPAGQAISLLTLQRELAGALGAMHREPGAFEAVVTTLQRDAVVVRAGDALKLAE